MGETIALSAARMVAALRLGLGRALMHARAHAAVPSADDAVEACTHAWAYDPQSENDRAPSLFQIASAAGLLAASEPLPPLTEAWTLLAAS